ncbi:MAG: hypothetical protein JWP97_4113 [Labilithrix sp.]|nr:hypothetical protein [Labilithrix sp.]
MTKLVILTFALAALPPSCAKMLGKKPAATAEPVATVDAPPPPISSATAPPVWHAPEPPPGGTSSDGGASGPVGPGPDIAKARTAADAKEWKKVRSLLERRVLHGRCAPEESLLLLRACTQLKDKSCVTDIRAKHPDDVAGQ